MIETKFINQPNTLNKIKDSIALKTKRKDLWGKALPDWQLMKLNLSENMSNTSNINLANVHRFKIIKKNQCLFVMLDLPTHFLNENQNFMSDVEQGGDNPIHKTIRNSIEFSLLNQSGLEFSGFNTPFFDEWEYDIQTSTFLEWLECVELIEPQKSDNSFFNYNNYRGWAKVHNTIATLIALEAYSGILTTSSTLKDKNFYKELSKELVTIERDGTDKPKPKTLENYVSEYNNPPKK